VLLNPSILALLLVSALVAGMMLLAAGFGLQVLRHWDIASGSERQLRLEQGTYLISTLVAFCFLAELVSLLLFVYNAEQLSSQFVGAMCATGVLNVNPYGWPALYLKIALFFAGATWLILNRVDNLACDYPLIRMKYRLLLWILPLVLAEPVVQGLFFLQMDPDIITSCCGALFTPEGVGVAAELSAAEPASALALLIAAALITLASGGWYLFKGQAAPTFALSGLASFPIALLGIVSCVALYIYEHPHHHCPFCILKSGHHFMGYFLYIPLFVGTALALGVGAMAPFRRIASLSQVIPAESRRFVGLALVFLSLFYLTAGYAVLGSNLTMLEVWW